MLQAVNACHLPDCPLEAEAYHELYAFNNRVDDYSGRTLRWQRRRLRPHLTELEVYRRLPSAARFEYGGYLTRSSIVYSRGSATEAWMPRSKACTFHSHPSAHASADVPSLVDVFQFLHFRHLRTVTIGKSLIWVWDKTSRTVATIRKLAAWSRTEMLLAARRLERKHGALCTMSLMEIALSHLGLVYPRSIAEWTAGWPTLLRRRLKLRVRVFPRRQGG